MTEKLEKEICRIIKEVGIGCSFDSHYIIENLTNNTSKVSNEYYSNLPSGENMQIENLNSQISTYVKSLSGIEKLNDKHLSKNSRGKYSENALWKKVSGD